MEMAAGAILECNNDGANNGYGAANHRNDCDGNGPVGIGGGDTTERGCFAGLRDGFGGYGLGVSCNRTSFF